MRILTEGQRRVLELADRGTHFRVKIDPGTGFIDFTNFLGYDWVEAANYNGGNDVPVASATIMLFRQAELLNLAPFVDGSKANQGGVAVDIKNPIIIDAAVVAEDLEPAESDFVEVFRGNIDQTDWANSPMTVQARDQGGLLVDTFIKVQRIYGSADGVQMEDVIQGILDDNINTPGFGPVTLFSVNGTGGTPFNPADSPAFPILPYAQSKQNVHQAIRQLAQLIGFDVKYRFHANTGQFQLVFFGPDRELRSLGTLTFTGQPLATQDVTVNGVPYTAVGGAPAVDEFMIGTTPTQTVDNAVASINTGSDSDNVLAWAVHERAIGTVTLTGTMTAGDTIENDGTTYTARTVPVLAREFLVGATASETADNFIQEFNRRVPGPFFSGRVVSFRAPAGTAIRLEALKPNADGTEGNSITLNVVSTQASADGGGFLGGTVPGRDRVRVEWKDPGIAGNAVDFTETLDNATADGAGFLGGTRLGKDGKTAPDFTFGIQRYKQPGRLAQSGQDTRNFLRGTFLDPNDRNTLVTVERDDPASILKYGERFAEFVLGSTQQIDTIKEMDEFLQTALNDMSEPDAEFSVQVPYFWPVEDGGDLYGFTANPHLFDTDQKFGIRSFRHTLQRNDSVTMLDVGGKPTGGVKRWLEIIGDNIVGAAQDLRSDNPSDDVILQSWIGGAIITYNDPRTMSPAILDWKTTRVHVEQTPGFAPHDGNLKAEGRLTRFVIEELDPSKTYEALLLIIDEAGNIGQQLRRNFKPGVRGPLYDTRKAEFVNLIPNGEFGQWSPPNDQGLVPPDNFVTTAPDNWGADAASFQAYFVTSPTRTGGVAIRLSREGAQPSAEGLESVELMETSGDEVLFWETEFQDTVSGPSVLFTILFFDSAGALVQTQGFVGAAPVGAGVWFRLQDNFRTVAAARSFSISMLNGAAAAVGRFLLVDRVRLLRSKSDFKAFANTVIQAIPGTGVFTKVNFDTEDHDHGNDFNLVTDEFTALHDGTYQFAGAVTLAGVGNNRHMTTALFVNGAELHRGNSVYSAGGTNQLTGNVDVVSVELSAGDLVDLRVETDAGGGSNTVPDEALVYLTGSHVK